MTDRGANPEYFGTIRTFVAAIDGVGASHPTEFMLEFREWTLKYPNAREQGFDFAIMDTAHIDMINRRLMASYGLRK